MGQIVKRKKKGRPSKADLAKRESSPSAPAESELRRSHRRRNVRYNIDFDDYLDEDFEDEDDEEERRREKKLKLILKLNQDQEADLSSPLPPGRSRVIVPSSSARGRRTMKEEVEEEEDDAEEEDEEEESERRKRKIKKRRINVRGEVDDDEEEEQQVGDDDEEEDDGHVDVDAEMGGRKGESKGQDSVSGTPSCPPSGIPLPDKKTLESILDSLQTKDRFGVYSEPVDPEELPDYHDVVEHPMDFSTMRKKLRCGSYSILEQFESDVFLICSNAMQYNASDTIYYRQARSIQRLAEKKFRKLRIDAERSEGDSKIEQKTKTNFVAKKQIKKPLHLTTQEPVGSDFSSGVILSTAGDILNTSVTIQANVCEKPSHTDLLIDGNSSMADYNIEKAEELSSGKGLLSKFGRKSATLDDNRRATYNISNQPVVRSDSIFTTFEAEIKQLVAVGLQAEFSYARSLARFAATLGPVAWKVASRRIEQALPIGCKFGRGWVGEYEPLPTPVLTFESRVPKETTLFTKLQRAADVLRDDISHRAPIPATDVRKDVANYNNPTPKPHPLDVPVSEGISSSFHPTNGPTPEGRSSLYAVAGPQLGKPVNTIHQQQNLSSRISESEGKVTKQVELNLPPTANQNNADLIVEKKNSNKLGKLASKSKEMTSRNKSPAQAVSPKQNENNVALDEGLSNGKLSSSCLNNRAINLSSEGIPTQMTKSAACYSHGQEQGFSDPVQLMRILAEKAQKQQNSSNQFPVDTPQNMSSVPPIRRDESSNAAAAAARAWMSIGAGAFKEATENPGTSKGKISAESLYNPARELHPQASQLPGQFALSSGMQFQPQQNSFPFHGFAPQQVRMISEAQFQNRPLVFPQLVTTDLSRFQGLSPRAQPRQKQDSLPPDLNIGFQSPGSPGKQSSGVLVDSQQPDLALQL